MYELHLRCQALGRSTAVRRRSEARRAAVAAEAARQRTTRLQDILRELRTHQRLWR